MTSANWWRGGIGGTLYQHWPLIRLVVEAARMTVVHNARVAGIREERFPTARIEARGDGSGRPARTRSARCMRAVRDEVRRATQHPARRRCCSPLLAASRRRSGFRRCFARSAHASNGYPQLHFMLVGSTAPHYEPSRTRARGESPIVSTSPAYVADADARTNISHAADICACLRWPTNRETSASWLRCLAAGQPHNRHRSGAPRRRADLDPRGWRVLDTAAGPAHAAGGRQHRPARRRTFAATRLERLATDRGAAPQHSAPQRRAWWRRITSWSHGRRVSIESCASGQASPAPIDRPAAHLTRRTGSRTGAGAAVRRYRRSRTAPDFSRAERWPSVPASGRMRAIVVSRCSRCRSLVFGCRCASCVRTCGRRARASRSRARTVFARLSEPSR